MKTQGQRKQDKKFLDLYQQALAERNFTVIRVDDILLIRGHRLKGIVTAPNHKIYPSAVRFTMPNRHKKRSISDFRAYRCSMQLTEHPEQLDWSRLFRVMRFQVHRRIRRQKLARKE